MYITVMKPTSSRRTSASSNAISTNAMNVRDQKDDFAKNAKPLLKYSLLSLGTPILASNVDIYTIEDVSSKTCAPAKSIKLSDRSISSDIIRAC